MTDQGVRVTRINSPRLNKLFTEAMRGRPMPPPGSAIPKTRAEFDRMVAEAEADLLPTPRGRPTRGDSRAKTRSRSIRAPESLWVRLDAAAKARGLTANQVVVQVLEQLVPA